MVKLHVKRANDSYFLYETTTNTQIDVVVHDMVVIFNGILKIHRICSELEDLSKHGVFLPLQMQGLTDEQIQELKLKDQWAEMHLTSENYVVKRDPVGRRNGKAPLPKIADVISRTISEAKTKVSKNLVQSDICLKHCDINDALDMLKGAVMIAYPMGLPQYEPVKQELDNEEDLSGTQAALEVLEGATAQLWWAGKELQRDKKLLDYVGKNEKTKIVVKLQKTGQGAPAREPILTEEEHKQLMLQQFRRQEELKKLEEADDDSYLNSAWADNKMLKKSFQGIRDIKWATH